MRISAMVADDSRIGMITDNGNVVGEITGGGTVAIFVFVGLAAGLSTGLVLFVLRTVLPNRLLPLSVSVVLLAAGSPLVIDPSNPDFTILGNRGVNVAMFVALLGLPDIADGDLASLVYCVSGGAPLPGEIAARMGDQTGQPPVVGWGMTETCGAGTLGRQGETGQAGAIGYPLPGASVEILTFDDDRKSAGVGEIGEIAIRGPNVIGGYWNRPGESAEVFAKGRLLTGDMGFIDAGGQIHLVDGGFAL